MAVEAEVLEKQFSNNEQQSHASLMGMWIFLATEILLFGSIITAFMATRVFYPQEFEKAAGKLNVLIGGLNTVVLLGSSLTMALAVHGAQTGKRQLTLWCLVGTMVLGGGFLGLKGFEYYVDWRDGIVPLTERFQPGEVGSDLMSLFMMFYFITTGLHAIHLTIGIGIVTCLLIITWRLESPLAHATVTEVIGLYWHFVDIVWIFLLPVLYLSGNHTVSGLHF